GRRLADQDAVVPAHIVHDRLVEAITTDARRSGIDDAVQRQYRDLGRTAADVEHHRAARLVHRQAGANCCGHRFAHDPAAARTRALGRFLDRAALDLCGTDRYAHEHPRRGLQHAVAVYLVDEVLQHLL